MPNLVPIALEGFSLSAALILAIGAQNAFVLRQGLRRQCVGPVVAVCILSDTVLILAGTYGLGSLVQAYPSLPQIVALAGAAFLLVYGLRSLKAALDPGVLIAADAPETNADTPSKAYRRVLLTCLALTFLNPHVYLDTVVLLGGLSGRFAGIERAAFAGGAILASALFFLALGYGARLLAPLFAQPRTWRALDLIVAATMFFLAGTLLWAYWPRF